VEKVREVVMDDQTTILLIDLVKELGHKVDRINDALVGREACGKFRENFGERLQVIEGRLQNVEKTCNTFEVKQSDFIDAPTLSDAKYNVLEKALGNDDLILEKLKILEDKFDNKMMIFDLTWNTLKNNKILFGYTVLNILMFIGVYYGRGNDAIEAIEMYGWDKALFGFMSLSLVFLVVVVVIWSLINRKRVMLWFS
jgi:hypothetical protein